MKTTFYSLLTALAVFSFAGCDVDVEEEGKAPSVDVDTEGGKMPDVDVEAGKIPDVDVDAEPGKVPDVEVRGPDVEFGTEKKDVKVPDVDVDMEEKEMTLPDVDIDLPKENDGDEVDPQS